MTLSSSPENNASLQNTEDSVDSYGRAASELRSVVLQCLEASPVFCRRLEKCGIDVVSDGDRLILNGRVPSWYLKQLLHETVRRVPGVGVVENQVVVINPRSLPREAQQLSQNSV